MPALARRPAGPRRRPRHARVWFLGDSLTAGYDAGAAARTFTALTAAALAGCGAAEAVYSANRYGGKAADGLRQALAEASFMPDLVVLQFGENDRPYTPAFRDTYARLVRLFTDGGRRPLVAALAVWDPAADPDYAQCTAAIRDSVREAGGVFVDITDCSRQPGAVLAGRDVTWLNDAGHLLSDSFHPSDTGHAAIAGRLLEALLPRAVGGVPRRARRG